MREGRIIPTVELLYMSATSLCESLKQQHTADIKKPVPRTGAVCSRVCAVPCGTFCEGIRKGDHTFIKHVIAVIENLKVYLQIFHLFDQLSFPMPESGDVKVLNPNSISRGLSSPSRRRVGLALDFSQLPKRCKLESMNFSINSSFPHTSAGNNITGNTCINNNNNNNSYQKTILPHDLAGRLNKSKPVLVLDCRPFFAYNANHIQGAVNINCSDRFNRRRLQQGKCSLVDLVTTKEGKDTFKKRWSKEIVLYDERTADVSQIGTDATLYLVLTVLLREGKQASILKGKKIVLVAQHKSVLKAYRICPPLSL